MITKAKLCKSMLSLGFSSFICSVGMGFTVVLFNQQIMRYFGNQELAIFGIGGNIFILVQSFSYGIGNAAQPIVAENLSAGKIERVNQTKRLSCKTAAGIGLFISGALILSAVPIVRVYMKTSEEVIHMAAGVLRMYFTCLLFVPFNVFTTYYLQATQKVKESILLSVLRGFVFGCAFLFALPAVFGGKAIWLVMLVVEAVTAGIAFRMLR